MNFKNELFTDSSTGIEHARAGLALLSLVFCKSSYNLLENKGQSLLLFVSGYCIYTKKSIFRI